MPQIIDLKNLIPFLVFLNVFFLTGCEQKQVKRYYEEEVSVLKEEEMAGLNQRLSRMLSQGQDPHAVLKTDSNSPQARLQDMINSGEDPHAFLNKGQVMQNSGELSASVKNLPVSWQTPEGWMEKPASGMRLASFGSNNSSRLDVSIISLAGPAGGLMANINRWLLQIGLKEFTEKEFNDFLAGQKKIDNTHKLSIRLIDLTALQPAQKKDATGILAAILETEQATLFIKMTGSLSDIERNRESFLDLCRSLELKNES